MKTVINNHFVELFEVHSHEFILLYELGFVKPLRIDYNGHYTEYRYGCIKVDGKSYGYYSIKKINERSGINTDS